MYLPFEIRAIILEYADFRCCMCKETLFVYNCLKWSNTMYIHKDCKHSLELLML